MIKCSALGLGMRAGVECKKPAKFVLSYVTLSIDLERVEAHHTWDLCYEHGKKWMDPLYCQGYVLTPLDPKLNVFL